MRFRNLPQRLGIDAGIRALAVHSAEDAKEHSANLTFSILPKADGTGWQASLAWRRGASDARFAALGGNSPWTAPSGSLPGAETHWIAQSRLGYGISCRVATRRRSSNSMPDIPDAAARDSACATSSATACGDWWSSGASNSAASSPVLKRDRPGSSWPVLTEDATVLVRLTVPGQSKPSVQIAGAYLRLAGMILTSRNGASVKPVVIDTGLEKRLLDGEEPAFRISSVFITL